MYVTHAKEALQNLSDKLLELEKNPKDQDIINECFRLSHTIKGMARTMTFERTGEIAHSMESILDGIRSKRLEVDPGVIDLLFQCVDAMEMMTENVKDKKPEPDVPDLMAMIKKKLKEIKPEEVSEGAEEEKATAPESPQRLQKRRRTGKQRRRKFPPRKKERGFWN